MTKLASEIIQHLYNSTKENEREASREMMKWGIECLQKGDIQSIDDFYIQADEKLLCTRHLVAAVRHMFSHRAHLPHWESFRLRALKECQSREPSRWKEIFIGLTAEKLDDNPSPFAGILDHMIGVHPSISKNE